MIAVLTANRSCNQINLKGQNMYRFSICPLIIALLASNSTGASAQESFKFPLRVECRKTSDKGCTADPGPVCANAPSGYFFAAGQSVSGQLVSKHSPRTHWCKEASTGAQGVPIGGGLLAPTSMCASLHAESGGGMGGLNDVFHIECSYTATIHPIPK